MELSGNLSKILDWKSKWECGDRASTKTESVKVYFM